MPYPKKRKASKGGSLGARIRRAQAMASYMPSAGSGRPLAALVREMHRLGPYEHQLNAVRARRAAAAIQRMVRHRQAMRRWAFSHHFRDPPRKRGL